MDEYTRRFLSVFGATERAVADAPTEGAQPTILLLNLQIQKTEHPSSDL
jgi:hypothetical protein